MTEKTTSTDTVEASETNIDAFGDFVPPPVKHRGWKRFKANKAALGSLIFLIVITILCYVPGILARYPQNDQDLMRRRLPPSGDHWLGTDLLGRDILTELLYAGQVSLRIAVGVGLVSTLVGAIVGAAAGYFGRWIDGLLMRCTDLFLVVPQLIILILALRRFGGSDLAMVGIVASISWMFTARLVRSQVMSLKSREFIDAARVNGRSGMYIIIRYLIPNSWSVIAVSSAFTVAASIILESTVSFLGYGVQAPKTSWGRMLYDMKGYAIGEYFYLFLAPSIAIFLTVLAFNFVSDGLRDALDPRSEQS